MAHKKTAKNPKGAGRPKGSKNKHSGPGRPKGSTNRHPGLRLALLHKRKRGPGRPRKHTGNVTMHGHTHHGEKITITGTLIHHK